MAVIQISKIQVRRGLQENLPQLASGEMGWSIDDRRLFIGNGTLSEGAPEIGNTEILTIYSPIGAALSNIAIIEDQIDSIEANISALQANVGVTTTTITLTDNTSTAANTTLILGSLTNIIDYNIVRSSNVRVGTIRVTQTTNGSAVFEDDYSETGSTGVNLSFFVFGSNAVMKYTTTNTGFDANLSYYNPKAFQ